MRGTSFRMRTIALLTLALCASCAPAPPPTHARAPEPSARWLARAAEAHAAERALLVERIALDELARDVDGAVRERLEARRAAIRSAMDARRSERIAALTAFVEDPALAPDPGRAAVLMELGRALQESGDAPAASRRFEEVADQYPESREAARASLALAEVAFAEERFADAISWCDRVLVAARGAPRSSALYLKAWSLRALGDEVRPGATRDAVEALDEIAKSSDASAIGRAARDELAAMRAPGKR